MPVSLEIRTVALARAAGMFLAERQPWCSAEF
jgi:hypothetical protein